MTDKEIMAAVRGGDIDRIGLLFDRHHLRLFNFFLKLSGDRETSEDLVQEVFLRVIRYRATYKGKGAFTTWAYRIAYNCFCDYKRQSNANRIADDDPDSIPDEEFSFDPVEREDERGILRKALMKLESEDREILILSAYEKMKYHEIAGIMGCSEGRIKTRVFRSIRKLRKILSGITSEA